MPMSIDPSVGFVDNWAYLRVEFNWLERMLMVAVARQRKETKEIDRMAQSRADRVSSHWWQGVITLDGKISYDDYRKPPAPSAQVKPSYQQQLTTRIHASRQQGIALGLPLLCDRLQLSSFEKSLILIALAPEVNRRYAKIYQYLQGDDDGVKSDLPTVNVVLQLLCHNDHEWRAGRAALLSESVLQQHGLITLLPRPHNTLLNQSVQLTAPLVNFLLCEQPTLDTLNQVLNRPQAPGLNARCQDRCVPVEWSDLVLPAPLLESLQMLSQRVAWSCQSEPPSNLPGEFTQTGKRGILALLVGSSGTGKSIAAQAIAHQLQQPLTMVDLAQVPPQDYLHLLQEMATRRPPLLLIKAAQHWLRRTATLPPASLTPAHVQQFLTQRQQQAGMTLLSVPLQEAVSLHWQRQIGAILRFALPEWRDRLILWQRAFPSSLPLADDINWAALARQRVLTGAEIGAIARTAASDLATSGEPALTMAHLRRAIAQQGRLKVSKNVTNLTF